MTRRSAWLTKAWHWNSESIRHDDDRCGLRLRNRSNTAVSSRQAPQQLRQFQENEHRIMLRMSTRMLGSRIDSRKIKWMQKRQKTSADQWSFTEANCSTRSEARKNSRWDVRTTATRRAAKKGCRPRSPRRRRCRRRRRGTSRCSSSRCRWSSARCSAAARPPPRGMRGTRPWPRRRPGGARTTTGCRTAAPTPRAAPWGRVQSAGPSCWRRCRRSSPELTEEREHNPSRARGSGRRRTSCRRCCRCCSREVLPSWGPAGALKPEPPAPRRWRNLSRPPAGKGSGGLLWRKQTTSRRNGACCWCPEGFGERNMDSPRFWLHPASSLHQVSEPQMVRIVSLNMKEMLIRWRLIRYTAASC